MAEPTSTAGAGAGFLAAKLGASLAGGLLGALIIAAVDPPQTRRELFLQAAVAGIGSMVFGPAAVRLLDHYTDAVDLARVADMEYLEWSVPVYFVIGALAWGAFGALAKLRQIIRDRAGDAVARELGMRDEAGPSK